MSQARDLLYNAAWARSRGVPCKCPACGREVEIVRGYWTQHSDPATWPKGVPIEQCRQALTRAD